MQRFLRDKWCLSCQVLRHVCIEQWWQLTLEYIFFSLWCQISFILSEHCQIVGSRTVGVMETISYQIPRFSRPRRINATLLLWSELFRRCLNRQGLCHFNWYLFNDGISLARNVRTTRRFLQFRLLWCSIFSNIRAGLLFDGIVGIVDCQKSFEGF